MPKAPKVSVLMPFYDDGRALTRKFFSEAVEGVLAQTFQDFELILVVDGIKEFAQGLASKSGKIIMIYTGREGGYDQGLKSKVSALARARNRAVTEARGEFVAFADADDISLPERLATQLEFLQANPKIGVLGCSMILIDGGEKEIGTRGAFVEDAQIRRNLLRFNTMPQPAVMARKELIVRAGLYSEKEIAEDYDLWVRLAKLTEFHNLEKPLVKYRVFAMSGATRIGVQLYFGSLKVKCRAMRTLGVLPGPGDICVNLLQAISLLFPHGVRRGALEAVRSKLLIGKKP